MRKILHIDMDAFFASVEQRDFPELRGKPVIVGGKPESRGVVAACSYEARQFGVHSAMPCAHAAKLCEHAIFVPARFEAYRAASLEINEVFKQYSSAIEPLSLDEAYLDVTRKAEEYGSATEVAKRIKCDIKARTDLVASAGVSYNKFLAKIASDMDKPDGLYVIRPESAEQFIESLEIRKFFGVGKVTEKKMQKLGIFTGADLKALNKQQLQAYFGRSGAYYYNIARGVDERPVRSHRVRKSIGAETTFEQNIVDKSVIWQTLLRLCERVHGVLSDKKMDARTVTLKVKYSDFTLNTRSKTLSESFSDKDHISGVLPELLKKTQAGSRPVRLVGVSVSNLTLKREPDSPVWPAKPTPGSQLGLF
ncbi:DNA polymerase IV [Arenicella sp. 4NH20-0111]|uniref:DNA polymerase IV n=1 Tax=Arenicella sp. 4NH20-0111 TaxID=3127648 RepID=UPI003104569D